jgi:hypothetical protein
MLSDHEEYRSYVLASRRSKKALETLLAPLQGILAPLRGKRVSVTLGNNPSIATVFTCARIASQAELVTTPAKIEYQGKFVTPPIVQFDFKDGKINISLVSIRDARSIIAPGGAYCAEIETTKVKLWITTA